MSVVSIDELLILLDTSPVVADIHPVSLSFLPEDVMVVESAAKAAWLLDDPTPIPPQRILITESDPAYRIRFPEVRCNHDPFTPALNDILFDRFDDVANAMLRQSQVADHIAAETTKEDLVVLFLVDGLSYGRLHNSVDLTNAHLAVEPCLVDVPTFTRVAFPNLIGDPPVAARLFDRGFHSRLGYTYWGREDNQLTDWLFRTIGEVNKTAHFLEILKDLRWYLSERSEERIYVQIVRTGLDGYAHGQKRKPPVSRIVREVMREFEALAELCQEYEVQARLYLTADHGILWRDEFDPEIVGDAPGKSNPRSCGWRDLYQQQEKGRRFVVEDEEYYCLGFPKVRRPLRIDEQGVHGGISYQESIVPFVSWEVFPDA